LFLRGLHNLWMVDGAVYIVLLFCVFYIVSVFLVTLRRWMSVVF